MPALTTDLDAHLAALVGSTVYTIDRGEPNEIRSLHEGNVIVGTRRSPAGAPVPVSLVREAAAQLEREGELRIHPDALGHRRSSFVGAVLATLPEAIGLKHPQRVRLRGSLSLGSLLAEVLDTVSTPRIGA